MAAERCWVISRRLDRVFPFLKCDRAAVLRHERRMLAQPVAGAFDLDDDGVVHALSRWFAEHAVPYWR